MQKLKSKLSGKLSWLLLPLMAIILAGFFGCAAMQDVVTPCYIDPEAQEYAGVEPNECKVLGLYTTLWDAKRVTRLMDRTNAENQKELTRLMIDDEDSHAYLMGGHVNHIAGAESFKETMFSPSGPIGMAVPALMAFGIGALGVSKPKDKKKIVDLEKLPPPK